MVLLKKIDELNIDFYNIIGLRPVNNFVEKYILQ